MVGVWVSVRQRALSLQYAYNLIDFYRILLKYLPFMRPCEPRIRDPKNQFGA